MNKKTIYGVVGAVLVVLLAVGGFFAVAGKKTQTTTDEQAIESIPAIDAKEIGLSLVAKSDGKNVKVVIENLKGIKHIQYELTYDADSKDPEAKSEGVKVPRGFDDEKDITDNTKPFESKDYFLGTCSSGTCIPDKGVGTIKVIVKITKTDGKVYQSDASLDL